MGEEQKARSGFVIAVALAALVGVVALGFGLCIGPAPAPDRLTGADGGADGAAEGEGARGGGAAARVDGGGSDVDAGVALGAQDLALPVRLSPATVAQDPEAANGAIEGRVVDGATGRGVARATIELAHAGATQAVRTGRDGTFAFVPPQPGAYVVAVVSAEGYLPYAPEWGHSPLVFTARAGTRVRDVVLYLTPAVTYTVAVVDPAGEAVAGAEVKILGAPGEQALAPLGDRFTTDARGEARLHAPDGAVIEARHERFAPGRATLDFSAQVSHRLRIALGARDGAAPELASIAGRVLAPDGAAIDGALVRARFQVENPAARGARTRTDGAAVSDEQGSFAIGGLDPGSYELVASHPDHADAEVVRAEAGAREVELRLRRGARIEGRVVDGAGAPIPSFTVVVAVRAGPLERRAASARTFFDSEGRFALESVAAGSYVVTASAFGYAPSRELEVRAPGSVELRLTRGGSVRLHVVGRGTANPVEGARVSAEGRGGGDTSAVPVLASVLTDERGEAVLAGLEPGLQSVMVAAAGHHGRIVSALSIREGAELGPLRVELTPVREGEEPRLELAGIGAVLAARGDALVIGEVLPGGGAHEAGLVSGDAILAIDGVAVTELGFGGGINRIRGPEGTTVRLRVRRATGGPGAPGAPTDIAVPRRIVRN